MKFKFFIFIVFLFASCSTHKHIKFSTMTFMSKGNVERFEILVPNKLLRGSSLDIRANLFREWNYKDASKLYISLDMTFADSPNKENWMKCLDLLTQQKCENGIQDNGLYWKEIEKNNLVVGYQNVPLERIAEFDKALESVRKLD